MRKSKTALENKSAFLARHKRYFLNRLWVRKEDGFTSFDSTFDVEAQKPFLKIQSRSIQIAQKKKIFRKRHFHKNPYRKDSWYIKTQLNSWCNCLRERKNPISHEIFLRRNKPKRQFSGNFISSSVVFWKDRCLRSFQKFSTENVVYIARLQKSQRTDFISDFSSTIDE